MTRKIINDLNDKQVKFILEYLIDMNGKQAAIRAGYSEKTAEVQASRLLSNAKVQEYLGILRKELQEKLGITQEMVIEELAKVAFSKIGDVVSWDNNEVIIKPSNELSATILSSIAEINRNETKDGKVTIKVKLHDKNRALELIGRHLGMFTDKVEVSGDIDISKVLSEGLNRAKQRS